MNYRPITDPAAAAASAAETARLRLPRTCTKFEFDNALAAAFPEARGRLHAMLMSDPEMMFTWNMVQDLDRDNAVFRQYADAFGATEEQLDAVFAAVAQGRGGTADG